MRIGELARQGGVSVRALRYYEEQGLLSSERSSSGQRHFGENAVARVHLVQQLYAAGLSSRTIVDVLPCIDTGSLTQSQQALLFAERARIDEQIASLEQARSRLQDAIDFASARDTGRAVAGVVR